MDAPNSYSEAGLLRSAGQEVRTQATWKIKETGAVTELDFRSTQSLSLEPFHK